MRSYIILLVEDNPDDVKQTLRAFARNNIANEVVVARDGAEALDYLFGEGKNQGRDSSIQPALVLLDLKLPRIPGIQVLQRMRTDDRTRNVPVVILTSSSEESDVAACYAMGANNYLRKPVNFSLFLNAVRSVGLFWTLVESGLALLHGEISASPPPDALSGSAEDARPVQPLEVLVVVPDAEACDRIATVLEEKGHTVQKANAANTAFRRLFARLPDVVITDVQLPDISGMDLVRTLRDSAEGRRVMSVLLAADVERCRRELPDEDIHIVAKPYDVATLPALLANPGKHRPSPG